MLPELLHPDRPASPTRPMRRSGLATDVPDRGPGGIALMPARWIHQGGLRAFRADAGYVGRSIAALKLYLTLAVSQDERSAPGAPIALSYERIAALSGLSDPLICSGKKALLDQRLVAAAGERQGRTIAYTLCGPHAPADLAILPHGHRDGARIAALHALTCRKAPHLAVLKIALLLTAGADEAGLAILDIDAAARLTGLSHVKVLAALAAAQDLGLAEPAAGVGGPGERRPFRLLPLA